MTFCCNEQCNELQKRREANNVEKITDYRPNYF